MIDFAVVVLLGVGPASGGFAVGAGAGLAGVDPAEVGFVARVAGAYYVSIGPA